ncbi:putative nucleotidyltransferase [compost metagenome]
METFSGWEHPLDFSGWDLRKFLTSARDTGSSTYEWAFSPIVYFAAPDFLGDVQHVMGKHFNARASFHHYRNMAWKCLHQAFDTNSVKSALYALRCLLCAHYVYHYRQQPPVALTDLVQSFSVRSETVYRHIGVVHQFLMEHKQSENATAQLLPHRETLNLLAVTVEGVGAGNDVWGAPDHPDLELDNSTLMAYSRLLQKHHAP